MTQREGQVAEELGIWRRRACKRVAKICGQRLFLAVQALLILRAQDEEPELLLALA